MIRILPAVLLAAGPALAAVDDAALRQCRAMADAAARVACYDAIPLGQPAAAPRADERATERANEQRRAIDTFGMPAGVRKENRVDSYETHIAGRFDGWEGGQVIRLANGQAWRVVDSTVDTLDLTDPKVTVRRGLSGAVFLDIDGANRSPRVQRVQ
ncbi:hypothetical protein [Pseudoduganella rivuli]|uniref:hypothetical protein n=1 Tax=Pseudoduganella rivuli TaxID=2666085 RepID=UPI0012B00176|nr:hypothetical protein [Pseudoduganella rivuli]